MCEQQELCAHGTTTRGTVAATTRTEGQRDREEHGGTMHVPMVVGLPRVRVKIAAP